MQVGRNDPCPCGSGRKYKKCCLDKDQQAAGEAAMQAMETAAAPPPQPPGEAPSGPVIQLEPLENFDWDEDLEESKQEGSEEDEDEDEEASAENEEPPVPPEIQEARNRLWTQFDEAGHERKIAIFHEMLGQPGVMDKEYAAEMLEDLHTACAKRGEHDRFAAILSSLQADHPELYAQIAGDCAEWRMRDAMDTGRTANLVELAREYGSNYTNIDLFTMVHSELRYRAGLAAALEAAKAAWPRIKADRNIFDWARDEAGFLIAALLLLEFIDRQPDLSGEDQLIEQLKEYADLDPQRVRMTLLHALGRTDRQWKPSDLTLRKGQDSARQKENTNNLFYLLAEFAGCMHRERGVDWARAWMFHGELTEYILQRTEDRHQRGQRTGRDKPARQGRTMDLTALVPEPASAQKYYEGLFGFLQSYIYRATAFLEASPHWLRFLLSRSLLDEESARHAFDAMRPWAQKMLTPAPGEPLPAALHDASAVWEKWR